MPKPLRNVLSNWGAFVFSAVAGFFLAPYIVRELGNATYGAWVLLASMVGYLGLLDLGVRGAVMRYVARLHAASDHHGASRFASAGLFLFSVSSLIAIGAGIGLALTLDRLFRIPPALLTEARIAVVLSAITIALALMNGVFGGVVAAMQRFDLLSGAELCIEILRVAAIVLILRAGQGIVALASVQLAGALLRLTVSVVLSRKLYPQLRVATGGWTREHLRQIIGYSLASTALHSAAMVILQFDAVVIGAFLPVAMVTFFSIAGQLSHYGRAAVDGITHIVPPRVSAQEGMGDMEGARRTALVGGKIATLVHLPIIVTFMLRGDTFIRLWMGPEYAALSGEVLLILSLGYWFIAGRQVMVTTLMGLNRHRVLIPAAWTEAALNVTLSVILVQRYGVVGVAWGTTIPFLINTTFVYPLLFSRSLGLPLSATWRELWLLPSISIVPFMIVTYLVERFYAPASLLLFFGQVAALLFFAIGGALWIALNEGERRALSRRLPRRMRLLVTIRA
jgi:O-antigen/teichoic acid export membrane protein